MGARRRRCARELREHAAQVHRPRAASAARRCSSRCARTSHARKAAAVAYTRRKVEQSIPGDWDAAGRDACAIGAVADAAAGIRGRATAGSIHVFKKRIELAAAQAAHVAMHLCTLWLRNAWPGSLEAGVQQ